MTILGTGAMTNYDWEASAPWSDYQEQITSVVMTEGVTSVGNDAFYCCEELTSVALSADLTTIGKYAFAGCVNLPDITIPDSVTAIRDYVFSHCADLKDLTFCGNAPSFGRGVFSDDTATACYPANNETWTTDVMQSYDGTITWEAYYEVIEGGDSTVEVGSEEALSIRAAGEIDKFECVIVDGEIVDPSNYTVTEGSTIITFTPEYVANLAEGDHEIVIRFTDGIATATVTVESAYLPGDINGDGEVSNRDAARIMQYIAGWDVEVVEAALDVNGDGEVNNRDAARIMQYIAGWNVEIH